MITLNEELRLPGTLKAMQGLADEVIVVDAGSTDRTEEIARSYGVRFFHRDWDNYSSQKRYAESLCTGDWLMNIDADEEISPALSNEIRLVISRSDFDAFRVRIADIFPGCKTPCRWAKKCNVVRLYRRGAAKMEETHTCDRVRLSGPDVRTGQLKHLIHHRTFVSISQIVGKFNSYSDQQAEAARATGKIYPPWRMLLSINGNFLRYFILHRRFMCGWWGYISSVNMAYLRFLKFAKCYEADSGNETLKNQENRKPNE